MNADFLNLPWELQVALASGYAAYMLAYTGLRDRHRTIDVAFISVVFSLIATAVLALTFRHGIIVSGLAAFVTSVLAGAAWRRFGRWRMRAFLRKLNITWADDDPSALATLSENSRYAVTQIAVLLDDGTWLQCDNAMRFNDAPFGPCLIGPTGDVALYLTHQTSPGEAPREQPTVQDEEYGDRLTYIPASRVRAMNVRHLRHP